MQQRFLERKSKAKQNKQTILLLRGYQILCIYVYTCSYLFFIAVMNLYSRFC